MSGSWRLWYGVEDGCEGFAELLGLGGGLYFRHGRMWTFGASGDHWDGPGDAVIEPAWRLIPGQRRDDLSEVPIGAYRSGSSRPSRTRASRA